MVKEYLAFIETPDSLLWQITIKHRCLLYLKPISQLFGYVNIKVILNSSIIIMKILHISPLFQPMQMQVW